MQPTSRSEDLQSLLLEKLTFMKADFAEIKRTTDIVAVMQERGVELKREGKDWRGLCPFHADAGHPNMNDLSLHIVWDTKYCNTSRISRVLSI